MLARIQLFMLAALLAITACWGSYFASTAPWLAAIGAVFICLSYSGLFAVELFLVKLVNKGDPAPQPMFKELLWAWWGETVVSPQVFFWRQPFRSRAIADLLPVHSLKGQRGVVLIHGFFCNRGFWTPWLKRLRTDRIPYVALTLEPVFGPIDGYAAQIEIAIEAIRRTTGLAPLVVCHSMGGLALRAWLKAFKSEDRIHHAVTIGTPHRGTWLARFSLGHNGRQMRLLSEWHAQLDTDAPAARSGLFTCWYSNADNIVFPASTATLPGADNRLVRGAAHVQMAFLPEVMNGTLSLLDGKNSA